MHSTLIRHVKDTSSLATQLLWVAFHQISRQLAAGTSGNPRQMATNHAKIDCITQVSDAFQEFRGIDIIGGAQASWSAPEI